MLEQFEEARSIRRKMRKDAKTTISEEEKRASERRRVERELEETIVALDLVQAEAEKYNIKLKETKKNLRTILYSSELGLEEKARKVAEMKSKQENCEFVIKQATSKWARLTDKRKALEKELEKIDVGK